MTAPSIAAVPEAAPRAPVQADSHEGRRRNVPAPALPFQQFTGVALAVGIVVAVELLGRPSGVEPVAFVAAVVLTAVVTGGLLGGLLAAGVTSLYALLYYSSAQVAGSGARLALTIVAAAIVLGLTTVMQSRLVALRARAERQRALSARFHGFTLEIGKEPADVMPDALVRGASRLLDTDMAVLTLLDPHTGRHFVRAVHGGAASAMGVEVIPGVGVTGQALRERRTVVAASPAADAKQVGFFSTMLARGRPTQRRIANPQSAPHVVAAIAAVQAGRVIATLTVGRTDGRRPFDEDDMAALDLVRPVVTLAVSGSLQRQELEQGSPRDAQTGLYNRAYLDAALDQLLALRRRTAPAERDPLSMIMFDIDNFRLVNERHGRQVGDAVLRAVTTILRQRFRASDILARDGADSFFVVLNGADSEVAAEAAAHIRRQVRELNITNSRGEPVIVSISAGCAVIHDGERSDALFRNVEAALDTARWSGPGAVVSI